METILSKPATYSIPMSPNTDLEKIFSIYKEQEKQHFLLRKESIADRILKLKKLKDAVLANREKIQQAVYKDLRKNPIEVDYAEVYNVVSELKTAIANLPAWASPEEVDTPLMYFGSSSKIVHEPKGMALILTPWNYPFQMPVQHLVAAVAAGCTVIIKPSEFTPHTSSLVKEIISSVFSSNEVAVVEGDFTISTELLKLKFDHIHFTGSPAVGKIVMKAAAEHLTSVTLELGGKSPVIIDETANLDAAVKKLIWGKFLNLGQTCIAPDYVLIDEKVKTIFIEKFKNELQNRFGNNPQESPDLARIVNNKHFNRLKNLLENAVNNGAKIEAGGVLEESQNYISPTLISNVSLTSSLMQEEIFGPILPVISFTNLQEAIDLVNTKEKPLALYLFSSKSKNQDFIITNTSAGGTCINDNIVHISQPNLPFGGVNNSGIGKSFGRFGFLEFTNERAVLKALHRGSIAMPLWFPYKGLAKKMTDIMIKFF